MTAIELRPEQLLLLEQIPKVFPPHLREQDGYVYRSPGDLVQREGEWFEVADWQNSRLQLGNPGFCFYNARRVVTRHPHAYTYCEGYALVPGMNLPALHAWVVDPRGIAWDVTWRWGTGFFPPATQAAMLGVRVPYAALRAHWRTCGGASLLADYYHHYPCLKVPFNQWEKSYPAECERLRREHCLRQVSRGRAAVLPDGSIFHNRDIGQ